jgi:DNA-binding NarL/FixJ family response regulator
MRLLVRLIEEKQAQQRGLSGPASDERSPSRGSPTLAEALTPRELEVLRLIARGETNQQIAEDLSLSVSTVKNHVHHIFGKLGASDRFQAVVMAIDRGLLTLGAVQLLDKVWLVLGF